MLYRSKTLHHHEVPHELRVPYIRRGYRLLYQRWSYYMSSLFHVHNETINIWTHLIGCVVIVYQVYNYFNIYSAAGSNLKWTVLGFGSCCSTTLFNSATAHLLHSKSAHVNYVIFMYDYVGVVSWGFGTAILAVYGVSDKEAYEWVEPNFLFIQFLCTYINFLNICVSKLWYGRDLANVNRKRMMVGGIFLQALSCLLPWFPRFIRCSQDVDCDLSSLNHITIVTISFVVMTTTFVLHQPEKSYPGRFDIIGQSHQIFHILVPVTMTLQFRCLYIDFRSGVNAHCKPDMANTLAYVVMLNIACISTILYLTRHIKRTLNNNNNNKAD